MNSKQKSKAAGFTLVEILVVLGVLTILSTILVAVFGRVRENGRRTVCQSNLKQIALAMQQYVADADGYYPIFINVINKNTANAKAIHWHEAIAAYIKNPTVFRCPSNQLSRDRSATDYLYNHHRLNIFMPPFPTNDIRGTHDSNQALAATVALNRDATWLDAYGNYIYGGPPILSSCGRSYWGSTLHFGGANYSFVDGHVKWLTPQQMGEIECSNGPLPFPFKD